MTTPQQPTPQPIYPRDLGLALDRTYNHYVGYVDGKFEALAAQMRIGFADALARDEALVKRIETLETTMQTVIQVQREILAAIQEMRQEMRTGFASLDEKINELTARVVKLEGGLPPAANDA